MFDHQNKFFYLNIKRIKILNQNYVLKSDYLDILDSLSSPQLMVGSDELSSLVTQNVFYFISNNYY